MRDDILSFGRLLDKRIALFILNFFYLKFKKLIKNTAPLFGIDPMSSSDFARNIKSCRMLKSDL